MTAGKHPFKAFVFDAFGTVVTPVGRLGPYQRLGRECRVDAREFRLTAMTEDVTLSGLADRFGRPDLMPSLQPSLEAEVAGVRAFNDVLPYLNRLDWRGFPYAICSNLGQAYGDRVRKLVPGAKAYVFSYEAGVIKPDPAIYARTSEALGVEPSEILFVGDTPSADVTGPRAFGMQAALIDRGHGQTLPSVIAEALRLAALSYRVGA